MTIACVWFNAALRPQKPQGSLGRGAQDGHLDFHTAPELDIRLQARHGHVYITILNSALLPPPPPPPPPPRVKPTPQSSPDTGSAVCLQSSFFNHGCSSPDPPLPVHQSSVQTTRCMRRDDRSGPISANICATGMKACKSAVERKKGEKEKKKRGGGRADM